MKLSRMLLVPLVKKLELRNKLLEESCITTLRRKIKTNLLVYNGYL